MSALELLTRLVACDSTNPDLAPGGCGEGALADLLARELADAGLEVDRWDVVEGRPNVVGRLRGRGDGPTLLLCSHMDVVPGTAAQFVPEVRDGRLHGRGSIDMKGGLAASLEAVRRLAAAPGGLAGDVLLAGVIDEEWASAGAVALAERYQADAALLPEETALDVVVEHGGFAWFELKSHGRVSAGIEPDVGVDAIALLAPVLEDIAALDLELAGRPRPAYGRPSIHASTISGGTIFPTYPAVATLEIERCTVPGEPVAQAIAEVEAMVARARRLDARFRPELTVIVAREPVCVAPDEPVVLAVQAAAASVLGAAPRVGGDMGWMDSGVLVEAGIPCVVFGPAGSGHHTEHEWVDIGSLERCADVLEAAAVAFCGRA